MGDLCHDDFSAGGGAGGSLGNAGLERKWSPKGYIISFIFGSFRYFFSVCLSFSPLSLFSFFFLSFWNLPMEEGKGKMLGERDWRRVEGNGC